VAQNIWMAETWDEQKVAGVRKRAKVYEFLEKNHEGIFTQVGDKGVKLSGGQKQRVAIARALYNDPEILVLDEATSALDAGTENEIMKEIYDLSDKKTLIIIAHRLSTIEQCDFVYTVANGRISRTDKNSL